jgi:homoserine kinase
MISGAGPTVLVLHNSTAAEHDDIIKSAGSSFAPMDLELSPTGATVSNA